MKMSTQRLQILNALFFAALMLVMAAFVSNKENGLMLNNFLIAAWFLVSAHLSGKAKRKCHNKNKLINQDSEE